MGCPGGGDRGTVLVLELPLAERKVLDQEHLRPQLANLPLERLDATVEHRGQRALAGQRAKAPVA
jgi:hypothetical protein